MNLASRCNHLFRRLAGAVPADSHFRRRAARIWNRIVAKAAYVELEINGYSFRLIPKYRSFAPVYEPKVFEKLLLELESCDGFLDVGANLGLLSIFAARSLSPRVPVVAIEANPNTFHELNDHLLLNLTPGRVKSLHRAGSNISGMSIGFSSDEAGSPVARMDLSGDAKVQVSTIRIDEISELHNCNKLIVKIDVEGAELLVLKGATKWLLGPHPPRILLAIHPMFLPEFGTNCQDVMNLLTSSGYQVFDLRGNQVDALDYDEYWCVKSPGQISSGKIGN